MDEFLKCRHCLHTVGVHPDDPDSAVADMAAHLRARHLLANEWDMDLVEGGA